MNSHKRNNKHRAEQNAKTKKSAALQQQNNDITDKTIKDDPGGGGGGVKSSLMADVINCDKKTLSKVQKQTISNQNNHQKHDLVFQDQQQPEQHSNHHHHPHHQQNVNSSSSSNSRNNDSTNSNSVKHTISNVSSSNSTDLKYLHKKFKRLASATIIETNNSLLVTSKESILTTTNLPTTVAPNHSRLVKTINQLDSHITTTTLATVSEPSATSNSKQQTFVCANESESSSSSSLSGGLVVSGQIPSTISLHQFSEQLQQDKQQLLYRPIFNQFGYTNYTSGSTSTEVSGKTTAVNSNSNSPVVSLVSRDNRLATLTDYDLLVAAQESNLPIGRQIVYTGNHKNLFLSELPSAASTLQVTSNNSPPNNSPSPLQLNNCGQQALDESSGGGSQNRYVCPYCQLNCAKPSVLQKHIRAHTNERPYPCLPCGFAFKTRSNLYKHCRSRAHIQKIQGEESRPDDDSFGSDVDTERELISSAIDLISSRASPVNDRMSSSSPSSQPMEKPYKPKFHNAALYAVKVEPPKISTLSCNPSTPSLVGKNTFNFGQLSSTASNTSTLASHPLIGQNVESLEQHISKIISENEAIIEVVEPALQKKYHRITGINRQTSCDNNNSKQQQMALLKQREEMQMQVINNNSHQQPVTVVQTTTNAAAAPPASSASHSINNFVISHKNQQQQQLPHQHVMLMQQSHLAQPLVINTSTPTTVTGVSQQPLNLSKPIDQQLLVVSVADNRKRSQSETGLNTDNISVADHPQNPERSIIKDLLLNSRQFGVIEGGEAGSGGEMAHTCPSCNISFRGADILKYHTICHCQGNSNSLANSPQSTPISPAASPSHPFYRSNSHGRYNPNSLKQIASFSLKTGKSPSTLKKLARSQLKRTKPDNLVINSSNSSPIPLLLAPVMTNTTVTPQALVSSYVNYTSSALPASATSVLFINSTLAAAHNPLPSPGPLLGKTRLVDGYVTTHSDNNLFVKREAHEEQQHSLMLVPPPSPQTLKMFGGEVKIMNKGGGSGGAGEEIKMQRFDSGGSIISLSPHSQSDNMSEPGSMRIRTNNLYSGGTAMQIEYPTTQHLEMQPATPKLIVTITPTLTPTITTPSLYMSRPEHQQQHHQQQHQHQQHQQQQHHIQTPTHFQFPPINSMTVFNPLTLPVAMSPGQASTIMHGGKLIPFVPGIPGPNSLVNKQQQDLRKLPQSISPQYQHHHQRKAAPSPLNLPPPANDNNFNVPVQQQSPYRSSVSPHQMIYSSSPLATSHRQQSTQGNIIQNSGNNAPTKSMGVSRGEIGEDKMRRLPSVKNGCKEIWSPAKQETTTAVSKKYNFTRIADNLSPKKSVSYAGFPDRGGNKVEGDPEPTTSATKYFNFENFISKSEIIVKPENKLVTTEKYKQQQLSVVVPMELSTITTSATSTAPLLVKPSKFLRPTSLPLKPGTFTPKQHHGITPTANTLPLISPETPRPSKSCVQLYLNGHAYTYLGLKCSTKTFYCTVNKPQPVYVANQHKLSMYSNWQVYSENNPHPLGLKPDVVMALYDSRQRPLMYATAGPKGDQCTMVNSKRTICTVQEMPTFGGSTGSVVLNSSSNPPLSATVIMPPHPQNPQAMASKICDALVDGKNELNSSATTTPISGGFESKDEYIYVRGRGRGKYVCMECGIRCKKPSMLKKHIRTHTDVRPYTCKHCSFSFKTKGNLTKHMKSKAHYKKCMELGIKPVMPMDDDSIDMDINDMMSMSSERNSTIPGDEDTDTDDESDGGDGDESEGSDTDESKSRLLDHEAAKCLLSLSMTPPSKTQTTTNIPQVVPIPTTVLFDSKPENLQRNYNSAVDNIDQRRIITFVSPKVGFDFLKTTGQYYSDPKSCGSLQKSSLARSSGSGSKAPNPSDNGEDALPMPMDLTKRKETVSVASKLTERNLQIHQKQQQQQQQQMLQQQQFHQPQFATIKLKNFSDVLAPLTGPASLLTSLNSINDKLPNCTTPTTENLLVTDENMQEYLTERALQDTKMKQHQMHLHKGFNVMEHHHQHPHQTLQQPVTQQLDSLVMRSVAAFPALNTSFSARRGFKIERSDTQQSPKPIQQQESSLEKAAVAHIDDSMVDGNSSDASRMEMLADVAASSVKLDVKVKEPDRSSPLPPPILHQPQSVLENTKKSMPSTNNSGSNDNAKIVASEYLKMTKSAKLMQTVSVAPPPTSTATALKKEQQDINEIAPLANESGATSDDQESGTAAKEKLPSDLTGIVARTVVVGEDSFNASPTTFGAHRRLQHQEDGRPVCVVCAKTFQKTSQLRIHINIHYMERKFRCEPCGVSFRTQGHLLKHERSVSHSNKVSMTSTFGVATQSNPRPFKCKDCKIAFRIHGHLAKHLRSKLHVLKLECLGKLPFGTYAEIERAGINLTEINTTDCDNSLASLQQLAQELHEKDPSKLGAVNPDAIISLSSALLDEGRDDSDSESVGSPAIADDEHQQPTLIAKHPGTEFPLAPDVAGTFITATAPTFSNNVDFMPLFATTAPSVVAMTGGVSKMTAENVGGIKRKLDYINLEAKYAENSSFMNNNNDLNGKVQDKRLKPSKNDT